MASCETVCTVWALHEVGDKPWPQAAAITDAIQKAEQILEQIESILFSTTSATARKFASNSKLILETFAQTPVSNSLVKTVRIKHLVSAILISAAVCVSLCLLSYDSDERNVFRVAVEQVHGLDGVELYVLRANTGPRTPFGMSSFHRKKLAVPLSANANFWIKNFVCRSLPANLALKYPYALASERDLHAVYSSQKPDPKTALLQTEIVKSYGVVALSRVGFNLTYTRAVIYVELLYCGLCGSGQYYYLAKQNGAWRVIDTAGTWIS